MGPCALPRWSLLEQSVNDSASLGNQMPVDLFILLFPV